MCRIGASGCASGEALKGIRGRSVLEYVTGAENLRNEASGVTSRAPSKNKKPAPKIQSGLYIISKHYLAACSMATATATVAPTIGLLPIPIRPIISTCAGTDEEPANCASPCILPIVSVIP